VKRITAFVLACLIALSSSVVYAPPVAAQGGKIPPVVDENKGKGAGLIIGCVVFFPLGCIPGFFAGWVFDDVVEPMIMGKDK